MGRLFGTDGIRGIANIDLNCELAMKVGKAVASVLTDSSHKHPTFLIGTDTRISAGMLESALTAGLCSVGANVICLGVVPTPAVAFLVKQYEADAGIMISASHNSYEYNGIKIFSSDGYKLPDEIEERIEDIILGNVPFPELPINDGLGRVSFEKKAIKDYIKHVKTTVSTSLDGMKIAIDCANGSSCVSAKELFSSLGATCHMLSDTPNGVNINDNCGSTHMENLRDFVINNKMDAGLAFDGDADRFLCIDNNGDYLDGDEIMAICAIHMKQQGTLKKNTLVGTVMSNLGLIKFCEANNIRFEATKVGDRYVLESMLLEGYNLGGEQSGHVIFLDYCSTGDGQLTAVQLLSIIKESGVKLSELHGLIKKYPQILINIKLSNEGKLAFYTNREVKKSIEKAGKELSDTGRILVRPSGTEPLVRVMVEAQDETLMKKVANEVADVIRKELT